MQELAGLLERERRLLEFVLFKLVEVHRLLAADDARFLAWASGELEHAVERVHDADLLRAVVVERCAIASGLPPAGATVADVADVADEPWAGILRDHAAAIGGLLDEIRTEATAVRDRAGRALRGVGSVLDVLGELDGVGEPQA